MKKVLIDGVEYVPKQESIEDLHKRQNAFIVKNNLSVGDIILVKNKEGKSNLLQITTLHISYGHICADDIKTGFTAYNIPIENIVGIYKWIMIMR